MGKLPLILVFLSVFIASTLANRSEQLQQCMYRCAMQQYQHGGSEQQHYCHQQCRKVFGERGDELVELMDVNKGRQCETFCQKEGGKPWDCHTSCKELDNQGRFEPKMMSRACEKLCQGKGFECQRSCMRGIIKRRDDVVHDNEGAIDLEHFARCQQGCLKSGGGHECVSTCAQASQRGGRQQSANEGEIDLEHFARCQQGCLKSGGGRECLSTCAQASKRSERQQPANEGEIDLEHFARCQQGCLKKGGGRECVSACVQESQRSERQQPANEGEIDLQRFAKCEKRCVSKGGGRECLSACVQESQRQGGGRASNHPALISSVLKLTGFA